MAVDLIFVESVFMLILMLLAFYFKDEIMAQIASLLMMVIGVSVLIVGIAGINNILTLAYGIIFVCFGFYVFMKITIEYIETSI